MTDQAGHNELASRAVEAPLPEIPAPPAGLCWDVEVKPGRTMPTQVTVMLRRDNKLGLKVVEKSTQCGAFFNQPEDEWFFRSVVTRLAAECIEEFHHPNKEHDLRAGWLRKLGL